jgi:uncharacterized protein DUF6114
MSATEPTGFRRWRRTRPFWGGVFAVLGGLEVIAIPFAPMAVSIHQGIAGVASWLAGALLIVVGVLLWVQPAQRTFYGILAVLLALGSFVTSNLGGFFLGMLLGLVGGALGFAWSPHDQPDQPDQPERPAAGPRHARSTRPDLKTMALLPIALPAVLGGHLLTQTPAPSASPAATPSATATPSPAVPPSATPVPTATPSATPIPTTAPTPEPPTATAPGSLTRYTVRSTLRASSIKMVGARFAGVATLPTANGPVETLKFTMDRAVLREVTQTTGAGILRTPQLTLSGNVVMFATKMSAKLLGVPVTFTPAKPPPLTLPYMVMTSLVSEQPAVLADSVAARSMTTGGPGGA